jgi:sugar/nucleoside kinase (ribokinase family)
MNASHPLKNPIPEGEIDLLAIGETLIDFISDESVGSLQDAATFRRYLGGSPANIAVYVAKLGRKAALISKTGIGAFGKFLKSELRHYGVNTDYLVMDHRVHTSVIFVSRTTGTPDFEAFRSGDYQLTPKEISEDAIAQSRIIHASTFALSREPCRSAVGKALRLAHELGKIVSLDPNYSPKIWPNYEEAKQVLRDLYQYTSITKPSLDDAQRLFGPGYEPEKYIRMFHEMGPGLVIMTMGKDGVLISQDDKIISYVPGRPVKVVDATGAGDSFWAGFLVAMLDGNSLERSALFAREVVEQKLVTVGPIPSVIDRHEIYARLPE